MVTLLHRNNSPFFKIIVGTCIISGVLLFLNPLLKTEADKGAPLALPKTDIVTIQKKVIANLETKTVTLLSGDKEPIVLPIISQGKPGSYYETIGGSYTSDYKIPLHFSSLGHVYMPYSVHVFGQYFIHGIPYYPSGEKVSSAYSGGCIRLADADAKLVYDFVDYGTPIIITREHESSFDMTPRLSEALTSAKMTLLMTAVISLETLDQETIILDENGNQTTRKELLPKLLSTGDISTLNRYTTGLDTSEYLHHMNRKATALGMSSTDFDSLTTPAATTYDDYVRFMTYISTYKSYLLKQTAAYAR